MSGPRGGVVVRGHGLAATTVAHLLGGKGIVAALGGAPTPPPSAANPLLPVVMLGEQAVALLRDVYAMPDLLGNAHRITRRVVLWGGGEPVSLAHHALAVSGGALLVDLPAVNPAPLAEPPAFTIYAAPPFPETALRQFGQRMAMAATVTLKPGADPAAALVEATTCGWLFLIPSGEGRGWLLGVGGEPAALLGQSRLVAATVDGVGAVEARFETAPRLLEALTGPDWLTLGSGALAFDPICGDGTATAVRAALLGAAVIEAIAEGGLDAEALLGHYRAMLVAAMRRHLQVSLPFYAQGGTGAWWREQAEALAEGHRWCTAVLAREPEPRFVLEGTRLVLREAVS